MDLIILMAVLLLHLETLVACLLLTFTASCPLRFAYFKDSSFISSFQGYLTLLLIMDLNLSFILTLGYYL
jgi:hypothetical protein